MIKVIKVTRENRWWNRLNRDTKTDAMEIFLFQLISMELFFFPPVGNAQVVSHNPLKNKIWT